MQFDFSLQPNGGQQIDVVGSYFKYRSGLGEIRVRTNAGVVVDLLPGQSVRGIPFTSLTVQDRSGVINAGVLLAGLFEFVDDTITGTVAVVDGGKAKTLSGECFMGWVSSTTAASYNVAGLFNPADSGKLTVIERVNFSANAIVTAELHTYAPWAEPTAASGYPARNKRVGGPDSTTRLFQASTVADTWPANVSPLYKSMIQAKTTAAINLTEPIILEPGKQIYMFVRTPGSDVMSSWEFREEQI